jgi:GTP cyclohydrolase FolE2
VAERQDTARARVTASATTVLSRATAITRQISRDRFHVHGEVSLDGESLSGRIGLSTTIITACPCTQAYSWSDIAFELAHTHGVELANEILPRLVTFTHSQRASACVTVDIVAGGPSLGHCYTALCDGAHTVNELLKRPDEHDLVQRAHARPQFSEDVVRDIAAALVGAVGDARVPSPCRVTVESEAVESIHSHSVDSRLDLTLEELRGALPAEQR